MRASDERIEPRPKGIDRLPAWIDQRAALIDPLAT